MKILCISHHLIIPLLLFPPGWGSSLGVGIRRIIHNSTFLLALVAPSERISLVYCISSNIHLTCSVGASRNYL